MVKKLVIKRLGPPILLDAFCMVAWVGERMEGSVVGAERFDSAKAPGLAGVGLTVALGVAGSVGRVAGLASAGPASVGLAEPGSRFSVLSGLASPAGDLTRDLSNAVCGAGLRGTDGTVPLWGEGEPGWLNRFGWASGADDSSEFAKLEGLAGASPGTAGRRPRPADALPGGVKRLPVA